MMALSQVIVRFRHHSPELADADLQATLDSLLQTFNTLEKGIYYDSAPDRLIQKELYLGIKQFLEGPAESKGASISRPRPRQILDVLQFIKELSAEITLPRPKSRAFLDHLESVTRDFVQGQTEEPRLIVPAEF